MTHHDTPFASGTPAQTVWRRLPFSDAPLGRQFALSESMLAALQETTTPTLRWYAPRELALALGNGQPPTSVDRAACRARGVAVYRRSSGGTAVLVDGAAFSLDIALPAAHPLATSDVTLAYRWVGEALALAMRRLGVATARAIPTAEVRALPPLARDDPLRLACYGTLSPWEVVVHPAGGVGADGDALPDGGMMAHATTDAAVAQSALAGEALNLPRKLVGLCQVRRRGGALFQIGFYRRFDAQTLAALLAIPDESRRALAARLADTTAGLSEEAPRQRSHSARQIMRVVERALTRYTGASIEDGQWTDGEVETADRIERERFERLV